MPTLEASGTTATLVINTETDLTTLTVNKTLQLFLNNFNLVNGDTVEVRTYYKVLSASTERLYSVVTYANAQGEIIASSDPLMSDISTRYTLKQTLGTGRTFEWKILSP